MNHFKTYNVTKKDIQKKWYLIDAAGVSMGRVAERAAYILRGKHKAIYTPHLDTGDNVIIINAEKAVMTGNKGSDKMYYRHSGYPGGLTENSYDKVMEKKPTYPMEQAIKGMLPHGRLGRVLMQNVKIYAGTDHPHTAQNPKAIEL